MRTVIKPLDYVAAISPYVPGKPIKELERELGLSGCIKLASNENPLGPSMKALAALQGSLSTDVEMNRYPDGSGYYLKNALSERLSKGRVLVAPEEIILGNGSNELIDIAVRTYIAFGDEAVMAAPSFVVYAMAVRSVGGKAIEVPLVDYRHDLEAMADALTSRTKIVFVANPNNPTGTMNTRDEFESFMRRIPEGVLVVVDEAYCEYVTNRSYPDSLTYFAEGREILILRTFSKAYGLAALRIGYGIAQKQIVGEMNKIRAPFNTSTVAQVAALHALGDDEHVRRSVEINEEGKRYLYGALTSLGLSYAPTEANFVYLPLPFAAGDLYDALLRKGVIVRPVGPRQVRVTIGLPEENSRFVEALRSVLPEMGSR
ncbi:MAG TPA: histidinol-phosphate transaminase [Dissulfurispiraceae bacterium]|nr:histidinol-phosphate transaminase [Dissulfurispiraceae bacterium]